MNKSHRFLIPSLSLLLVGSVFSCAKSSKNDDLFTVKTNVTITFNAIEGIGKWKTTQTSIRTLTLLKGYKWGYLKENLKDDLKKQIILGDDIETTRELVTDNLWLYNNAPLDSNFVINDDIILTANYSPVYIGVTFVASPESEDPPHHYVDGGKTKVVDKSDDEIQAGTKWKDIKDIKKDGRYVYIPIAGADYQNEPFLYYQNSDGEKVSDEYTIKDGDKLTAIYQINHPQNFMTDSWATISDAANLGFNDMMNLTHQQGGYNEEYLAESYEYHGHSYNKEKNTFVGLRHEVQIGKKTYDAIVVGENIDKVSNTANATLTFQIEQVVNTNKAYDTIEHNLNRYSQSALREYLNENFIYTLSPDLQNVIVPVNKRTNWGGREGSQGDVRESMEYVFAFSLTELGLMSTKTGPAEAEGFGDAHVGSYPYYVNSDPTTRIRKTLNNVAMPYWLRSPDCDVTGFAWAIGEDGNIRYEDNTPPSSDVTLALSVVCGFSVGVKR